MFPAGFNQKTAKEDLFVKENYGIPPHNHRGKTLEDSKRRITEAEPVPLTCGADWPHTTIGLNLRSVALLASVAGTEFARHGKYSDLPRRAFFYLPWRTFFARRSKSIYRGGRLKTSATENTLCTVADVLRCPPR